MNISSPPSTPKRSKKSLCSSASGGCKSPHVRRMSDPRTPRSKSSNDRIMSPTDRFIPSRRSDLDVSKFYLNDVENDGVPASAQNNDFANSLRCVLLNSPRSSNSSNVVASPNRHSLGSRVLNFSDPPVSLSEGGALSSGLWNCGSPSVSPEVVSRKRFAASRVIPSAPTRILDAPDIIDDYYLNLISWSSNNLLAVALGPSVYTWNADTNSVQLLCTLDHDDVVTSVSWTSRGSDGGRNSGGGGEYLAVGCNSSVVQIWDAQVSRLVRTLAGHGGRVASLSWNPTNRSTLSSGGRDALILNHDVRTSRHAVASLKGHKQEVCGLKWSPCGGTLASGGNENYLCLWDNAVSGSRVTSTGEVAPRLILSDHKAAVKALAWSPFQRSLLASGGGTADRTIKFWNVHTGALLNSTDTGSQVCSLLWSPHQREIVSSHGYSLNQLVLWRYPTMKRVKEFTGHTSRVLHLDQSPDGSSVVSAAADETLRFWNIFGAQPGGHRARHGCSPLGTASDSTVMAIR